MTARIWITWPPEWLMRSRVALWRSSRSSWRRAPEEFNRDGANQRACDAAWKGQVEILADYAPRVRGGWRGDLCSHHTQAHEARCTIAAAERGTGAARISTVCSNESERSAREREAVLAFRLR